MCSCPTYFMMLACEYAPWRTSSLLLSPAWGFLNTCHAELAHQNTANFVKGILWLQQLHRKGHARQWNWVSVYLSNLWMWKRRPVSSHKKRKMSNQSAQQLHNPSHDCWWARLKTSWKYVRQCLQGLLRCTSKNTLTSACSSKISHQVHNCQQKTFQWNGVLEAAQNMRVGPRNIWIETHHQIKRVAG